MAIFKQRNEDEYVEESSYTKATKDKGRLRSRQPLVRKKEPPKPWGKRERYLVLSLLLITVLTSAILALSAREWKLPGFPRLSFSSFHLPFSNLFKGGTIVIEGDKSAIGNRLSAVSQKIVREFKEETKNLSGVYGLYVVDLSSGYSFGTNENETFTAASLIKLPVMVGMYLNMENGKWKMEDKYTLKAEDKVGGAGSLQGKPVGYQLTYKELVELMGKQSDNTAFNICKNLLGEGKIKEIITKIGMSKTDLAKNETSPRDIGVFFEKLWKNSVVNEKNRDEILTALTDTIYENWLVAGVPAGTRLAHKYGREVHVVNDAGIVFTSKLSEPDGSPSQRPYVVVVMSKGVVEREADAVFPKLAKIVYENLTSN